MAAALTESSLDRAFETIFTAEFLALISFAIAAESSFEVTEPVPPSPATEVILADKAAWSTEFAFDRTESAFETTETAFETVLSPAALAETSFERDARKALNVGDETA